MTWILVDNWPTFTSKTCLEARLTDTTCFSHTNVQLLIQVCNHTFPIDSANMRTKWSQNRLWRLQKWVEITARSHAEYRKELNWELSHLWSSFRDVRSISWAQMYNIVPFSSSWPPQLIDTYVCTDTHPFTTRWNLQKASFSEQQILPVGIRTKAMDYENLLLSHDAPCQLIPHSLPSLLTLVLHLVFRSSMNLPTRSRKRSTSLAVWLNQAPDLCKHIQAEAWNWQGSEKCSEALAGKVWWQ